MTFLVSFCFCIFFSLQSTEEKYEYSHETEKTPSLQKDQKEQKDHTLKYETEDELLTKLWAMKLGKLNTEQRKFAEKIINDIFFEAEMNALTKNLVRVYQSPNRCDRVGTNGDDSRSSPGGVPLRIGDEAGDKEMNSSFLHLELSLKNPDIKV